MKLTRDPNFKNYFYEFGSYTFRMNETKCNEIHNIFKTGFKAGPQKYPDANNKLQYALIIKEKEYPRYEGYKIHEETNDIKLAQNLQRKTITAMRK